MPDARVSAALRCLSAQAIALRCSCGGCRLGHPAQADRFQSPRPRVALDLAFIVVARPSLSGPKMRRQILARFTRATRHRHGFGPSFLLRARRLIRSFSSWTLSRSIMLIQPMLTICAARGWPLLKTGADRPRGRALKYKKCELGAGPRSSSVGASSAATFTSRLLCTMGISPHRGRRLPLSPPHTLRSRQSMSPLRPAPGVPGAALMRSGEASMRAWGARGISLCVGERRFSREG